MFRSLLTLFLSLAVADTAEAQSPAPLFDPKQGVSQPEFPASAPANSYAAPQFTPPANVWNAQDPRGLPPPQRFDSYQPGFPATQQNAPATSVYPFSPGDSSMGPQGPKCCDPIKEYVLRILGLDHDPDYLQGYYDPFSTQFAYGATGVTPYQMGWYNKQEIAYVPTVKTSGDNGNFQFTELNGWTRYSCRVDDRHFVTWTLITNSRLLSGPSGVALSPDVNLVQSDFQIASNDPGPWNWQLGVTPQVNSDFDRQLTSDAYMVDARAVVFNKISPQLTLAIGAAYWDRNHGHFIPYGGVIWTPDDRWEFRAMFPKSRISYFAGSLGTFDVWFYGSGEYTLDAYQICLEDDTRIKQRMEIQDYRFMLGINAIRPRIGGYFEGGYITDRHVNFRGPSSDFTAGDAWMIRAGVTF